MPLLAAIAATLATAACSRSQGPASHNDMLMDAVEAGLQLPPGAFPLSRYGRYYAYDRSSREIVGIYLLPAPPDPPGVGCMEALSGKKVECPDLPADLPADQRRWVGDVKDLPEVMDGGCGVVTLRYDPQRRRIKDIACNGRA